jgi:deoxyadenosine/deoxycytidine kinase
MFFFKHKKLSTSYASHSSYYCGCTQIALDTNNFNVTSINNLKNIIKMIRGKKHDPFLIMVFRV